MRLTEQEVSYVAALANLDLSEAEAAHMARDLGEILTYVEELGKLDTTGVEPMAQVLYDAGETVTLRADEVRPVLGGAVALANAPLQGVGYFKVPKVIER